MTKRPKPLSSSQQVELPSQPPVEQELQQPAASEELPAPSASTSGAEPDFASIEAELGAAAPPAAELLGQGFLTKDQFFTGFGGMFTMASAMTGLKSLAVDESDQMARQASDAIYDTAAEMPMFHFLIRPGNIYLQRSLVILAFAIPKVEAVKAEAAARRNIRPVASSAPPVQSNPASDPLSDAFGKGVN